MTLACSTKSRVKGTKDMAALCIVLPFLLFPSSTWAGESCKNDYSEYGFALTDHAYESIRVDRLISCYMACSMQPACQSLNYNLADKTCDLNNDTKYYRPKYFVEKPTSVYAENRDSESPWRRLNSAPVCFGAKNNTFGRFQVEFSGSINAVKLVHLNGKVSCGNSWAKWACNPGVEKLRTFITDASNTTILPRAKNRSYKIPGYNSSSSEIIITDFPNPLYLSSGQDLRLWFGDDLFDHHENNNNGTVCTNVFVRYL
ncbi:uncharacterized protein LOC122962518 [Acropora millepora]|uniref:uncharacterized protein LOC122962518 n=1 Tax=Acropora millepora TaxID=45264 RepID=UPI001CF382E8|nr:uncharacterized protein LOC122962518 [Acropora millepora]